MRVEAFCDVSLRCAAIINDPDDLLWRVECPRCFICYACALMIITRRHDEPSLCAYSIPRCGSASTGLGVSLEECLCAWAKDEHVEGARFHLPLCLMLAHASDLFPH